MVHLPPHGDKFQLSYTNNGSQLLVASTSSNVIQWVPKGKQGPPLCGLSPNLVINALKPCFFIDANKVNIILELNNGAYFSAEMYSQKYGVGIGLESI